MIPREEISSEYPIATCTHCGRLAPRTGGWYKSNCHSFKLDFDINLCHDCMIEYNVNIWPIALKYEYDQNWEMCSTVLMKWAKGEF